MAIRLIGTAPNQVPTNADLGDLAFQTANSVNITGGTASLTGLTITDYTQFSVEAPPRPVTSPTIFLDFANSQAVDTRVTFSRGSLAYRINKLGYIESVDYDEPRIEYDPVTYECKGLLLEEAATNLMLYSSDLSNAAWTKTATTASSVSVTAPDAATTAYQLLETATTAEHILTQSVSVTSASNYTWSIFVKASGRTQVELRLPATGFTTLQSVLFDFSTTAVATVTSGSPTYTIKQFGNGWYRLSITAAATSSVSAVFTLALASGNATSYLGVITNGLYVWGSQLEGTTSTVVLNPASYIPTTSASVTRNADFARITGTDFTTSFNTSTGTFYLEGELTGPVGTDALFTAWNGSAGGAYLGYTYYDHTTGTLKIGNNTTASDLGTVSKNQNLKIASTYSNTSPYSFNSILNGGTIIGGTGATFTGLTEIIFNRDRTATFFGNMYVRRFALYPKALSTTELTAITRT